MNLDINQVISFNSCEVARKLRYYYESQSVLESMGVERKETRHSRFLCWLFKDKDINMSLSDSPINHFIDLLYIRGKKQNFQHNNNLLLSENDLLNIVFRNHSIRVDDVIREYKTLGADKKTIFKLCDDKNEKSGQSDIVIKATVMDGNKAKYPLTICIENKISMNEQDYQTWKYYTYFTNDETSLPQNLYVIPKIENRKDEEGKQLNPFYHKKSNEKFLFVYLKAIPLIETSNLAKAQCKCPYYIQICYQDLMNYVISPILQRPDIAEDKIANIQQYVKSLSVPALNFDEKKDEDDNKDNKVKNKRKNSQNKQMRFAMAIDSHLQNDIEKFYLKHPSFIENTIIGAYDGNENCKNILAHYSSFFEAILNSIKVSTSNETDYENSRELLNAIFYFEGEKSSLIKEAEKVRCLLNKSDIAVEFAKSYFRANPLKSITDLNADFRCVKNGLFSNTVEIREDNNTQINEEIGKDSYNNSIYFIKNIWDPDTLKKLIDNMPKIINLGYNFTFAVFNKK